jgi:thiamine-phosphate pyrophosphorylase
MHNNLPYFFIFIDKYNSYFFKNNNKNIGIIYRNYNAKSREDELSKISKACKRTRLQLFVSNSLKLAIKFKAQGLYIPSFNKAKNYSNVEKRNLKIIGSAHNQKEILNKIQQKCSAIFLSPIFSVAKSKKSLGIHKFNYICNENMVTIFPLGGIIEKNIKKLKLLNSKGFGGIRMFKKKPAYKRPVFIKNNFF